MVQLITQGIKVSVETRYEDTYYEENNKKYGFSYRITIENQSSVKIQLLMRYWLIKDALNHSEIVEGPGVIGQQPILDPGQKHIYSSGCLLMSPFGSMQGHYTMTAQGKEFKVGIPLFKLNAPFAMN